MEDEKLKKNLELARLVMRGEIVDTGQIEQTANYLRNASRFHYAGELYRILLKLNGHNPKWLKNLSICLYKDPDLPASTKFSEALRFLQQATNLDTTTDPELLGVCGAIYKRKWQYDNKFQNLIAAESYYRRGYEAWEKLRNIRHLEDELLETSDTEQLKQLEIRIKELRVQTPEGLDDAGYTAINYAYLLDLTAVVRFKSAGKLKDALASSSARERIKRAGMVRTDIITKLLGADYVKFDREKIEKAKLDCAKKDNIWALATLAEAYFGIAQYDGAAWFYEKYRETGLNNWELRTTADQLTASAELQDLLRQFAQTDRSIPDFWPADCLSEAQRCLNALFPNALKTEDRISPLTFRGKVGLALSGGGFRASLFHIGVLARLAELNVLRHVEVLSCVSGGSIIGAYYYMLLQREIEKHGDSMDQSHYIAIVREMEMTFLQGVQKNLRMRVFSNPFKNIRIFFSKTYSRTHRMGELYEDILYRKIIENKHPNNNPIFMQALRVKPADWPRDQDFNPRNDNWNRNNKVPMLVLNATSLNTGHNWQFTASWMGEPPGNIQQDVDSKQRLRRMYYSEAPEPYAEKIRLGLAVGASSCVPALFEPVSMPGLYPGIDLKLVDGGVHDNQGISSLLEQECKVMLVSDASGQLSDEAITGASTLGVFFRSDLVLQERVRENQFLGLKAREDSAQLNALMFIHLKKDLHRDPVNWKNCEEPPRTALLAEPPQRKPDLTSYGVRREVQSILADLRTDLDAFHDAEAYALMYSGYAQTKSEMEQEKYAFLKKDGSGSQQSWRFLDIESRMQGAAGSEALLQRLKIGQSLPFKVFKTSWLLAAIGYLLVGLVFAGVLGLLYKYFWGEGYEFKFDMRLLAAIGWSTLGILVARYLASIFSKAMNWQNFLVKILVLGIGAFVLSGIVWIFLLIFNPIYLAFGKLSRLEKPDTLKNTLKKIWDFVN